MDSMVNTQLTPGTKVSKERPLHTINVAKCTENKWRNYVTRQVLQTVYEKSKHEVEYE